MQIAQLTASMEIQSDISIEYAAFSNALTLSLTGVGPIGPSLTYMHITLKMLKVRYRQKLGIPQAGS